MLHGAAAFPAPLPSRGCPARPCACHPHAPPVPLPQELEGKLNGLAVRVPLLNASLTDCVFEVARPTSAAEVNALLKVRPPPRARPGPCGARPLRPAGAGQAQGRGAPCRHRCGGGRGAALRSSRRGAALRSSRRGTGGRRQAAGWHPPHAPNPLAARCWAQEASETYLRGILGFETKPLVSTDYINDPRR